MDFSGPLLIVDFTHPFIQNPLSTLCVSASHQVLGRVPPMSPPHSKGECLQLAPPGCTVSWEICLQQPVLCLLGRGVEE